MSKKCYRFFGGLLNAQQRWLNKMADQGYRLVRTGKLLYEFEECQSGQVRYCVEFIGHKSKTSATEYHGFLKDMGYQVFYKNINLNYSIGKVRWRPWAEKGGRIATNATTFNRELLIVEKNNDGKEFELHTTFQDRQNYYKILRGPYLSLFVLSVVFGILMQALVWGVFTVFSLIPLILYQIELSHLKEEAKAKEW